MSRILAAAVAAAALAAATAPAHAVEALRYDYQSAAGACQGALPAFAGTLRARPLALGNEGTSPAFVTCAQQGDDTSTTVRTTQVFLRLGNVGTGSLTINCTFVHGEGGGGTPAYLARSATLAPGASAYVAVTAGELGADSILYPQWSCGLPPNGVVYSTGRLYAEWVGD